MPDHVSTVPAPRTINPAPADPDALIVHADDWWTPVSIHEFRARHRVTEEVTDVRIRSAIRTGMQTALIDLGEWGIIQRSQGYASLAAVPSVMIDGESHFILCWTRAVMALAKDDLIKEYRDYDATGMGERAAGFTEPTMVDMRTAAQAAIRDLLGKTHTHVALI